MKIEIVKNINNPFTHDLIVDGKTRMFGESFPVVDGVRDSLLDKGTTNEYTEADEIADVIRADQSPPFNDNIFNAIAKKEHTTP